MKVDSNRKQNETKSGMSLFLSIASLLFVVGYIAGYIFPGHFKTALTPSLNQLAEIVKKTDAVHSHLYTFWILFSHNVTAALVCIGFGFLFGALSAIQIWTNGVILGFFMGVASYQAHIDPWQILAFGILPHGIFELPAFVWAAALGIANGFSVLHALQRLFTKAKTTPEQTRAISDPLRNAIRRSIRSLPYIVGLLLIAAIIESTITPMLLHWAIHRV